ncbi:MAG: pilus assembly protein Flp/PilA [Frankiales bacterium]|jgi:pilus assembly protein Flp/PilA|nr:pilus assembly protein Flp/PilA [Frankiales bacterium]
MLALYVYLQTQLSRLTSEDEGATAVEYGLMVSLIAIVIIGAVTAVGANLNTIFGNVAAAL